MIFNRFVNYATNSNLNAGTSPGDGLGELLGVTVQEFDTSEEGVTQQVPRYLLNETFERYFYYIDVFV